MYLHFLGVNNYSLWYAQRKWLCYGQDTLFNTLEVLPAIVLISRRVFGSLNQLAIEYE